MHRLESGWEFRLLEDSEKKDIYKYALILLQANDLLLKIQESYESATDRRNRMLAKLLK